jgi:LmbE family N-acetylglucosaminyl deacetylase
VPPDRPLTALHLAPHPDDEAIAAAATLLGLDEAGHRVINLACSLGKPEHAARRLEEVKKACKRAHFELMVHDPPLAISRHDDLSGAQRMLTATLQRLIEQEQVHIIVAPSPHDGHHGHEVVGRAARDAVRAAQRPPRLWLWGLWADLPFPTLYSGFGRKRLIRVLRVLAAHKGEIRRNDYRVLVRGRASANRVLGSERVFGFGEPMRAQPYAELLTEVVLSEGSWWASGPRQFEPEAPLGESIALGAPVGWWLDGPSVSDRLKESARPGAPQSRD